MTLDVQIQTLIFSFVYGLFFSFLVNLNYKYLLEGKLGFMIVINILFVLVVALLNFLLLRLINDGMLHFYFFLMVVVGFFVGDPKTKKIRCWIRKRQLLKQTKDSS